MKAFTHANPRDVTHALTLVRDARQAGRAAAIAGGGSDLLGMMKERLVAPDLLVNLKALRGLDEVTPQKGGGVLVGGLITLDALSRHPAIRRDYPVLAEAASSVATPQIRNVATLAGNLCQRPWCWYYRNGFKCLKNGGSTCYSVAGENAFHAIFGGGPSYIVHPSDTAPALVALDATFRIAAPSGERMVPAAEFFALPTVDAARENILRDDEALIGIVLPPLPDARSTYHKVLDREAWTHAVVSAAVVMRMKGDVCERARIVLGGVAPVPWRLPEVDKLLAGQRVTPALAEKAGDLAVAGARPLAHNGYKVPLTRGMVGRTIIALADPARRQAEDGSRLSTAGFQHAD
jgi:xanthine dehydrogenase YagS FAD-binding subunit